ncbi:hypothetical protein H4Q26_004161 [Puccinia striiformis f. sp. tritici PST-130]|nr:hypothetical protein H4Q26_004161 [Puccinia striiformis f. sp. tritici PST-130]
MHEIDIPSGLFLFQQSVTTAETFVRRVQQPRPSRVLDSSDNCSDQVVQAVSLTREQKPPSTNPDPRNQKAIESKSTVSGEQLPSKA